MGELYDFPVKEFASYREIDGVISAVSSNGRLEVVCTKDSALILVDGKSIKFESRQALAEFLWMATMLVDSHGKWQKDKYVGVDYV